MDTRPLLAYFYPTKVALIDDNPNYLNSLHLELDFYHASYDLFEDPLIALTFLKRYASIFTPLAQQKFDPPQHIVEIDISKIYKHIYNSDRFNEVSVIVVDYAMPGIDGLSLCEKLKNKPFKKILLTGEAQEQKAIEGFNKGLIHRYIRKDDPNFTVTINTAIYDLIYDYFTEQFQTLTSLPILNDEPLKQRFWAAMTAHKIVEYYLLSHQGSYLMLDSDAIPYWLGPDERTLDKAQILSYEKYVETL